MNFYKPYLEIPLLPEYQDSAIFELSVVTPNKSQIKPVVLFHWNIHPAGISKACFESRPPMMKP